jgi:hypothetical protein
MPDRRRPRDRPARAELSDVYPRYENWSSVASTVSAASTITAAVKTTDSRLRRRERPKPRKYRIASTQSVRCASMGKWYAVLLLWLVMLLSVIQFAR